MEREQPLHILLVDDEHATLDVLGAVLEAQGFEISLAATPEDAIATVERCEVDAVITDVVFDGVSAGERILAATKAIRPGAICLLMTGYPRVDAAVQAMKIGAVDYLQKPVDPATLAATVQRAVAEKRLAREELPFQDLVDILSGMVAKSIERVDPYTAGHGERTRRYCKEVAENFGLDAKAIERLELAAIAHDYGKIFLDDLGFLTKQGALTPNERREMQRHPLVGAERLGAHPQLAQVVQFVAEHHERWDGLGYPFRLKGGEISRPGRILCVIEVFDSLTTRRSYKNAWSLQKTIDYFESQAGRAFDPDILDTFLRLLEVHGASWLEAPKADLTAAGLLVPAQRGELPSPPRSTSPEREPGQAWTSEPEASRVISPPEGAPDSPSEAPQSPAGPAGA